MALPASGAISLNDLQTEFGGTNPISLNEYYRVGSLVPNTTPNTGIPTSGAITMNNFYGGIAFYGLQAQTVEVVESFGPISASLTVGNDGIVTNSNFTDYSWLRTTNNSASSYEIRATFISGTQPGGQYGTWLNLGTFRSWTINRNSGAGTTTGTIQLSIRLASTQVVYSTVNVTLRATISL